MNWDVFTICIIIATISFTIGRITAEPEPEIAESTLELWEAEEVEQAPPKEIKVYARCEDGEGGYLYSQRTLPDKWHALPLGCLEWLPNRRRVLTTPWCAYNSESAYFGGCEYEPGPREEWVNPTTFRWERPEVIWPKDMPPETVRFP